MTQAPDVPPTDTVCPHCGGREFQIHAVRSARVYVTFTPDGEHEVTDIKHDDTEWDSDAHAKCLGCEREAPLSSFEILAPAVTLERLQAQPHAFDAEECLTFLQEEAGGTPSLSDPALEAAIRKYLVTRVNWEAACDDLRVSAAEAET